MGTSYAAQAREILEDEAGTTRGERHRELARTAIADAALRARGYQPVESPEGMVRYLYDEASVPTRHRTFVALTLRSGSRTVHVNPQHVMDVHEERTHEGAMLTVVVLANGDPICVEGSLEDVVAQLEAVAL